MNLMWWEDIVLAEQNYFQRSSLGRTTTYLKTIKNMLEKKYLKIYLKRTVCRFSNSVFKTFLINLEGFDPPSFCQSAMVISALTKKFHFGQCTLIFTKQTPNIHVYTYKTHYILNKFFLVNTQFGQSWCHHFEALGMVCLHCYKPAHNEPTLLTICLS